MDESTVGQRISELLLVLETHHSIADLSGDALTAVPELFSLLADEMFLKQPEKVTSCTELISLLPYVCPPKELIIALLDQADCFKDYVKFKALLSPIKKSIQLLSGKSRFLSLDLAADNLYEHLATEAVPEAETELVEMLATGNSASADNLSNMVMDFLQFLAPFVSEQSWSNKQSTCRPDSSKKHVKNLTISTLKVLNRPLAYLNLSLTEPKTSCRSCAEICVTFISQLQTNFIKMIEEIVEHNEAVARTVKRRSRIGGKQLMSRSEEDLDGTELGGCDLEEIIPEVGLGVLAYLIFDQCLFLSSLPQIYTSEFLFAVCRRFVILLLKDPHSQIIHKGLRLCSCLLAKLPAKGFDCQELDCEEQKELAKSLMHVIISSKVKELNILAVTVFQTCLKLFDVNGRIVFLQFVSETFHQKNVQAYIVTLVKDQIAECLMEQGVRKSDAALFLKKFFARFFNSKTTTKTNVLDDMERILATLNMLRFLVIRDQITCNVTGIWDYIPTIQENYLKSLRADLRLMQTVIQERIQKLKRKDSMETSQGDEFTADFTIEGQMLEDLTPEQQQEAMQSASNNVDLIESILIRVEQLIDTEKHKFSSMSS